MKIKRLVWIIALLIALGIAWYLVSPVFRVVEVQEEFPVFGDNFDAMDAATKQEFERQVGEASANVMVMDETMPGEVQVLSQGDFNPRAHEVEGRALLISHDGERVLRFEDFDTLNGPNLHIYLASSLGDDDFVDLGKIKATRGNVNYPVDASVDIDKYNKVLVWCVPFGVLFSYVELQ